MLVQKPYHEPYIPNGPAGLPYVGAELESITSQTPFWRGQGIPIYPFEDVYNQNRYYAGPKATDLFGKAREQIAVARSVSQGTSQNRRLPTFRRPGQFNPED